MAKKRKFSGLKNKFRFTRRIKEVAGLNIATITFSIIFVYMLFTAIHYVTSSHVVSYRVTSSPLSRNDTYTGLILRDETIMKADSNGYVTYYAREGNKVNANGAVYGLSSTKSPEMENTLTQEEKSKIREEMLNFSRNFNSTKYSTTYSFKYGIKSSILHYSGISAEDASTSTLGNQTISKAPEDGMVLYSKDGYEGKTVSNLSAKDFEQNMYKEIDLKSEDEIKAGQEVYTLVKSEKWSILIPLSKKQASKLESRTALRVKFLKDDMTQVGDFSIIEIDGSKYGKLDFDKGLIRYVTDRFLDIELVTNTTIGLKIPLSSITTKEFYVVPSTYALRGQNNEIVGFRYQYMDEKGNLQEEIVDPVIHAVEEESSDINVDKKETYFYIDKNRFEEGAVICSPDGKDKIIVGETGVLEGVYCINQGYAVFRRIVIIDQNEEFAVISKDTEYGLIPYDYIIYDAKDVNEQDIIY